MNDTIKGFRLKVDPIYKKMDGFLEEVEKKVPNLGLLGSVMLSDDDDETVILFLRKHEGKVGLFCRIIQNESRGTNAIVTHMNDGSYFVYFNILRQWDRIQTDFELSFRNTFERQLPL